MNEIINGDCVEIMNKMDIHSIDLLVTSPPYNCGIPYDSYNDDRPVEEYLDWCKMWLNRAYRVLKPDGRICVNVLVDLRFKKNDVRMSPLAEYYKIMKEIGYKFAGFPMWAEKHRVKYTAWGSWKSARAPYIYCPYEVIIIGYKKRWKKDNKGTDTISGQDFMTGCQGIWKIKAETEGLTEANFPVGLPELCINLLSFKGDIVLDPFNGSGTTCVAAKKLGRRYIGIDISKNYCKIARARVKATQPIYIGGIFEL